MRILFLNQYFPPDPAPTGILMKEVADSAREAGHKVVFASSGQDYRAGKRKRGRLGREIRGLWTLFWAAVGAGRVDAVVSATSPPLLVVLAAVLAKLRRARHYHWLFDMYPELAQALGEIPRGMAGAISILTRWAYRHTHCVVALDEDMAARLRGYGVEARILPPWVSGVMIEARSGAKLDGQPQSSAEALWLYSGNLGRAHEWRTLLDTQRLLEANGRRWRLVFQGGGASWAAAMAYAVELGLERCEWRPYVAEADLVPSLLAADVLVVTQRPETCGLLWPSKMALAVSLPRRILWVGPVDRAIAQDLAGIPGAGIFAPGEAGKVSQWLENGPPRGEPVSDPEGIRAAGLREWIEMLGRASG